MTDLEKQFKSISDNFQKHSDDDLKHFAELGAALERIEATLKAQAETLAPIAKTFETSSALGRWLMPFLVAVSLIVGIIYGLIQILTNRT